MNEKNTKSLYKKFPKIFRQRKMSMKETAMCWNFSCGDGWYWLIYQLCDSIQSCLDNNKHLGVRQVEATQVKEKFGGLRFYVNIATEEIFGMIHLAEHMSYYICEECGSTEKVSQNRGGWIRTLCPSCRKEMGK